VPHVDRPLLPLGHIGVGCPDREEVDRLSDLARSEGCLVSPAKDLGGHIGYRAFIRDPDANRVKISVTLVDN
jgi:hypothetical protein